MGTTVTIEISFPHPPRVHPELIGPGMKAAAAESGLLLEDEFRARSPQGVGGKSSGLAASWASDVRDFGTRIENVTGSPLPYAPVMEWGRTPGTKMPPRTALIPWIEKKWGLSGDAAESASWALAKHIQKEGIAGRFMVYQGMTAAASKIQEIFRRYLGEALVRIVRRD